MKTPSAFVVLMAAAMMIVGTQADRKTCFCDLRYSSTALQAGESADSLPILTDLPNPIYRHWLSVGCRRVLRSCPNDCLARAHEWLGGSMFNGPAGQTACETVRTHATPNNKIHVYVTYDPSVCGGRSWQYVAPLCCCELSYPGFHSVYFYNHRCSTPCPVIG